MRMTLRLSITGVASNFSINSEECRRRWLVGEVGQGRGQPNNLIHRPEFRGVRPGDINLGQMNFDST